MSAPPPAQVPARRGGLRWVLLGVGLLVLAGGAAAAWKIFLSLPKPVVEKPLPVETGDNLVVFSAPQGAEVYINGNRVGVTGVEGFSTRIEPDRQHLVEVRKPGYVAYQVQVVGQREGRVKLEALLSEVVEKKPEAEPEKPPEPVADASARPVRGRPRGRTPERHLPRPEIETPPEQPPPPGPQPVAEPEKPAPAPAPEKPAPPPLVETTPEPTPVKEPVVALTPTPPRPEPEKTVRLLSGHGRWDGETALSRGCASCHNGSKAPALVYESKTQSQWEFFFQRQRHNRYAELDKLFSREELKAALQAIIARIAKKEKSGIAGER